MTAAKRKTATKPAHVKPLTSARWSGAKLSKTTEKKLNDAYAKRRTAKRKPAAKKVSEPKLSERTVQKINLAYRKRKMKPRREKREAEREAFKKANSKFIVGETYETFYISDHESRLRYKVIGRTAQFVTLHELDGRKKDVRCKLHLWDGHEACYPDGRYSMCPVLESTDRISRPKVPEGATVTAKLPGRTTKTNAVNMRGKEEQIERWLKGSDMWNMPHGIKAKLDSDGRPTLYRAPIGGSMTSGEVIEVIRSSRKNPWIYDLKSDVHGDIVDRDFAIKVLGKKS